MQYQIEFLNNKYGKLAYQQYKNGGVRFGSCCQLSVGNKSEFVDFRGFDLVAND